MYDYLRRISRNGTVKINPKFGDMELNVVKQLRLLGLVVVTKEELFVL